MESNPEMTPFFCEHPTESIGVVVGGDACRHVPLACSGTTRRLECSTPSFVFIKKKKKSSPLRSALSKYNRRSMKMSDV